MTNAIIKSAKRFKGAYVYVNLIPVIRKLECPLQKALRRKKHDVYRDWRALLARTQHTPFITFRSPNSMTCIINGIISLIYVCMYYVCLLLFVCNTFNGASSQAFVSCPADYIALYKETSSGSLSTKPLSLSMICLSSDSYTSRPDVLTDARGIIAGHGGLTHQDINEVCSL